MIPIGRYLICLHAGQHYPADTNTNDHLQTRTDLANVEGPASSLRGLLSLHDPPLS